MKRMLAMIGAVWLVAGAWALPALAGESLQRALVSYSTGDFVKAEKLLNAVIEKSSKKSDVAVALKYKAICQIMQGKAAAGEANFARALELQPNLTLDPAEVFDDEVVIQAFSKQKLSASSSRGAKAKAAPKRAVAQAKPQGKAKRERRAKVEPKPEPAAVESPRNWVEPAPVERPYVERPTERMERVQAERAAAKPGYLALLPFGAGQFAQGKTGLGAAFAASQTLMLFGGTYLYQVKAAQLSREAESDMSERDADARAAYQSGDLARGEEIDDQANDARAERQAKIAQVERQAMLCYVGFAGLWAASALEATIWSEGRTRARLGRSVRMGYAPSPGGRDSVLYVSARTDF